MTTNQFKRDIKRIQKQCHIEPDWLLVYAIDNGNLILVASRTGTYSDIF